jgi:hypothetical protein
MISLRLARLVEGHSEEITSKLIKRLRTSPRTVGMHTVPELELRIWMMELLQHLREWLLTRTDADIEFHYRCLGVHWASQGATLAGCCWTLVIAKDYLGEFLQEQALALSGVAIFGRLELLTLLNHFFDHAFCHLVEGYEESERSKVRAGEEQTSKRPECNIAIWVP